MRVLAPHDEEAVLLYVVELGQIVGLAAEVLQARARCSLMREVPTRTDVQIERTQIGDEHDPIDRGLVVVIVAVAGVMHHAEAEMIRHTPKPQLTDRCRVFGPCAFDPHAVLEAIDAGARDLLGRVEERQWIVAAASGNLVTTIRGWRVRVT